MVWRVLARSRSNAGWTSEIELLAVLFAHSGQSERVCLKGSEFPIALSLRSACHTGMNFRLYNFSSARVNGPSWA